MKVLSLCVLFFVLAAISVMAESPQRVATDAEVLLGIQQDRSSANHIFMETSALASFEDRITLNDYRTRFNALNARSGQIRHQITVALNVRPTRVEEVSRLRDQLAGVIEEHDALLEEFRGWVSSLRQE